MYCLLTGSFPCIFNLKQKIISGQDHKLNRGPYMSAHVLLKLLKELQKNKICEAC